MKLSFEVLEALDAIDRTGTFAEAAETLHRVPSSLSYLVQKLESDLETPLFDRSGRRAKFTHAGRVVVEEGRRLLQGAEELERKVQRVKQGWEAELRICIDEILPFDAIWPHVRAFYEASIDTRLHLSREVLGGTWDALITRRADLVVGAAGDPPNVPNLAFRSIGSMRHVFVTSPDHPLAQLPEPLTMETVARYRGAVIRDTSRELLPRTVGAAATQDCISLPTLASKLAAHIEGLAVGTLPECLATEPIARGELVARQLIGMRDVTHFYLAWREDETGQAMRWWLDRLDLPDLVDRFIGYRYA
ncbi:LysR family transcriptional regulator [Paraburkholderia sp. GAS334]|uniref:LysR family transcriptional regulator n=1 Tax=Paraburkholderia sp. GAS334 TaxID=3035131 RepID=UPI003D1B7277